MDTNPTENRPPETPGQTGQVTRRSRVKAGAMLLLGLLLGGGLWLGNTYWKPARAPDLSLVTLQGDAYSFQAQRGKPVLVVFWSTTCLQCLQEIPALIGLYHDLHPVGLEVVGVTMPYDMPSNVVMTARDVGISYPVALDVEGKVGDAFGGIVATPTSFLIAPDGRIVLQHTGATDMAALKRQILALIQGSTGLAYDAPYAAEKHPS